MGIFDFITGIFAPVTKLVDELITSGEEEGQLKIMEQRLRNEIRLAETAIAAKVLDYETKLMESQAKVITAEAMGQSWIQRNWRPVTMLTFLVLVVSDLFGFLAFRLPGNAWTLLQIGLGGYVVGRSVEKIAPAIVSVIKKEKR